MSAIDISAQTLSFFYSILIGIFLAAVYDFIKLLHHNLLRAVIAIQIADILYFTGSALLTFCFFMLVSNGAIRVYLLLGEGIGFVLWSLICSAYFQKILVFFARMIKNILQFVSIPFHFFENQVKKLVFWLKNKRLKQKTLENQ